MLTICLLFGCDCEPLKYPQTPTMVKSSFDSGDSQVENKTPERLNIFIDISKSHQGFILAENSEFLQSIREISSILDYNKYEVNFFKFGEEVKKVEGENLRDKLDVFHKSSTYSDIQTRFDKLFNFISQDADQDVLNLVFSDAIQSENKSTNTTYALLANNIRNFVFEDKLFGLLSKDGRFNGYYYPEKDCNNYKINDYRPYYCFILGSHKHKKFIETNITNNWDNEFFLSKANVNRITVNEERTTVMTDLGFAENNIVIISGVKNDTIDIDLNIELEKGWGGVPDKFYSKLEFKNIESFLGCRNDTVLIHLQKTDLNHSISVKENEHNLNFSLKIPSIKFDKGFGVYRMIYTPSLPQWIHEISTINDCDKTNSRKTFGFKNFTENLLRPSMDFQFNFMEIFIVVVEE